MLDLRRAAGRRWVLVFALLAGVLIAGFVLARERAVSDENFRAVKTLALGAGQFLLFTALCGLSSMATLDTLKRLLRLRGAFHSRELLRAEDESHLPLLRALTVEGRGEEKRSAPSVTRFDIPLEQLCAQLSAA